MSKNTSPGWECFSDELVLETPVVNVRSGPVLCKRSGVKKSFYLLEFPDWVNIVAVTEDDELVLIKQYRYGSNRVELEIPGGVIEEGESPEEAGARELLEECGYSGDNVRVIGKVNPNPAIQRNFCYTVLVENARKTGHQNMDEMEDIEVTSLSKDKVFQGVTDGTVDISHGLVLNALSFYMNQQIR